MGAGVILMEKIIINFNKKDDEEYNRQLQMQEDGLNDLTVQEYLDNRENYKNNGRSNEGNEAQQQARDEAFNDKVEELRGSDENLSKKDAEAQANEWLNTQHALHSPDQVAGGNPENVTGVGDASVNESIGVQWRHERANKLEEEVKQRVTEQENEFKEQGFEGEELEAKMTEWKQNTNLNVELAQGQEESTEEVTNEDMSEDTQQQSEKQSRAPPDQTHTGEETQSPAPSEPEEDNDYDYYNGIF